MKSHASSPKWMILVFALLLGFITPGRAGNDPSDNNISYSRKNITCLQMVGTALDKRTQEAINGATVILYKENEQMEWTQVSSVIYHNHGFNFNLDVNEYYTIEISKPGYVSRSIGISTMIPDNVSLDELFRYEFEVELFKEKKGVDDFYMDFPVALISYDKQKDIFNNHSKYTAHIKSKIKDAEQQATIKKP